MAFDPLSWSMFVAVGSACLLMEAPRLVCRVGEHLRRDDPESAVKLYSFVLPYPLLTRRRTAHLYSSRAAAYREIGKYQEGLSDCHRALEALPGWWFPYLLRALLFISLRDFEQARQALEIASDLAPNRSETHLCKGELARAQYQLDAALQHFDRAIELSPNCVTLYLYRGSCLMQLRRYEEAIANYSRIILRTSRCWTAYLNRAYSKIMRGYLQAAEEDLAEIERHHSKDADFVNVKVLLLVARGKQEDASELLDSFGQSQKDGETDPLILTRGWMAIKRGEYEEAHRLFARAVNLYEHNLDALWYRGEAREKMGERELGARDKADAIAKGYVPSIH